MIQLKKCSAKHPDFIKLTDLLTQEMRIYDGEEHVFYEQFHSLDSINHVLVAYTNNEAVACGAFRQYDKQTVEIKRMYVSEKSRGQGIASKLLVQLENWATELGYTNSILETGTKLNAAINMYKRHGYSQIPNFDQYKGRDGSVCFSKELTQHIKPNL